MAKCCDSKQPGKGLHDFMTKTLGLTISLETTNNIIRLFIFLLLIGWVISFWWPTADYSAIVTGCVLLFDYLRLDVGLWIAGITLLLLKPDLQLGLYLWWALPLVLPLSGLKRFEALAAEPMPILVTCAFCTILALNFAAYLGWYTGMTHAHCLFSLVAIFSGMPFFQGWVIRDVLQEKKRLGDKDNASKSHTSCCNKKQTDACIRTNLQK